MHENMHYRSGIVVYSNRHFRITRATSNPAMHYRSYSRRLDKAKQEQETAALEKKNLEQRLQDELSGSRVSEFQFRFCALSDVCVEHANVAS